ncbi:methionine-rich copper-binding protein CopC [Agrococcus sp. UYP10]|uniref:copper resistance CopC family protein n=1 Tax=Agrococcus sp. UYP10 TaxID=1756355 RepID=UPI0033964492
MILIAAAAAAVIMLPSHAAVIGSTPGSGDSIQQQPGTLSVVMNEEILAVEGAASANVMQLTDARGLFYGDGCTTVDGSTIALDAELGAAGAYTLAYQLVSADGHAVDGTVAFTFEPAPGAEGTAGRETAPVCGEAPVASASATTAEPAPAETTEGAVASAPETTTEPGAGGREEPADAVSMPLVLGLGAALLALAAGVAFAVKRRAASRARAAGTR